MTGVMLRAPRYVLGETAVDHTEIEGFDAFMDAHELLPDAKLWGWGTVHRTELSTAELAVRAGRETLRAAGSPDVDGLVLCSTRFPADLETHGAFLGSVLSGLGLDVPVTGVTGNRCANLLAGLQAAAAMVGSGRHRTVLVITTDQVINESERLTDFALFSDGAAACLITAAADGDSASPECYRWVTDVSAQDVTALGSGHEISADLARTANERVFARAGVAVEDLDGLLHNNIYLPIVTMKELQAGFDQSQLDTANVTRTGHCFAADPLINLADRWSAGEVRAGRHYLLASSVSGLRLCVLLQSL